MALTKPTPVHFSATPLPNAYYKVTQLDIDVATAKGKIAVACWIDKPARDANAAPLFVKTFTLGPTAQTTPIVVYDFAKVVGAMQIQGTETKGQLILDAVRQQVYTWLKTTTDFAGATDL